MGTISKKFISATLTATTVVWMSGVMLLLPAGAQAATTADLQAQISALLAQISQLQTQLGTQGGSTWTGYSFTRDLTVGSKGDDVKALQQFLNGHGVMVSGSGAGSPGNETTYFGSLTKEALSRWQGTQGITPAVGYFGPKTRAAFAAAGSGSTTTTTTTGGTTTTTTTTVTPPSSGLAVSLAATNPASGSLISSTGSAAARVPVLAVNLTAGTAGGITVTSLNFKKVGVLSDSSISGAYLVENGKVLAQYNSVSSGVVTFSGLSLGVNAGQTRTIVLAIDPAAGLSAGNTVSFALTAASSITTIDSSGAAITGTGSFPMNGNLFTVTSVANPSLATLTVASSSIGTTVTAGTQGNIVGAWTLTATNSKVNLTSVNFKVIGSANKSDLKNVKLYVNGSQVGSTLASVAADGSAFFDLSAAPGVLNTGSNNVQLYADVMGSPSYNFQFEILNSYDIYALDSQYNVPVSAQASTGTQVSINQGQITVTAATDTPTGNIAPGQSGVVLAKYTIYAAGEAVKVKWLGVGLNLTNASSQLSIDSQFRNLTLTDDAGGQVGTTVNTLSTTVTCTDTAFANSTTTYRNCFGNSSSPINYIIPANTTRVLSLRADVQSTAVFGTVTGILTGNTSNLQGLTSSATASISGVNGSALTLATNSLTTAKNTALGTQNIAAGATNRRIGSYAFSASSAEGVTVSNVSILMSGNGASFQNLKVKIGSTQFGQTQGVVGASSTYAFSGTPFTVPAGGTTYVDVYADVLSGTSAATLTALTTLSGCSGSGATSYTAISCTARAGQDVAITGQATVQISLDSASAPATQIVMGTTGVSLATYRFTETSNVEDVKVTDLNVFDQVTSSTTPTKSAFGNLSLYRATDLSTPLAIAGAGITAASTTNPGPGYYYKFHFSSPLVVPQANSVSLVLKGDVSSYSSSGATDNTTHIFKIATSTDTDNDTVAETVVALGSTSNTSSAISLVSATANTMTVLRSKLTVTATPLGATSGRSKSTVDDLATITFAADNAGAVVLNTVTITFGGSAPSATTFLDSVQLYDTANGTNMGTGNTTSSACAGTGTAASSTCSKTFSLGATTGGYVVSAGGSKSFTLRTNTLNTWAATTGISATLSASISANTDVRYTDGLDTAAVSTISLPATVVPITIQSISFAQGT